MRKTRPCSGPRPPATATWKRSRGDAAQRLRIDAGRDQDRGDRHRPRGSNGREQRHLPGRAPSDHRRLDRGRQAGMPCMDVGKSFGGDEAERGLEAGHVGERRGAAELPVGVLAAPAFPVPVEAMRRVAPRRVQRCRVGRHEGHAGLQHQSFLRRADDDVDAERVHLERRRAERGDDVDDEQRGMAGRVDGAAQRGQVAGGAAGGVRCGRRTRRRCGATGRRAARLRQRPGRSADLRRRVSARRRHRRPRPARPSRRRNGRCRGPARRRRARPDWRSPLPSRRDRWRRRRRRRRASCRAGPSCPTRSSRSAPAAGHRRDRRAGAPWR